MKEQHPRPARLGPGLGVGSLPPPKSPPFFSGGQPCFGAAPRPARQGPEGAATVPTPSLFATSQRCAGASDFRLKKKKYEKIKQPVGREVGFALPPGTFPQSLFARVSPPERPKVAGAGCREERRPELCPRVRAAPGPLAYEKSSRGLRPGCAAAALGAARLRPFPLSGNSDCPLAGSRTRLLAASSDTSSQGSPETGGSGSANN